MPPGSSMAQFSVADSTVEAVEADDLGRLQALLDIGARVDVLSVWAGSSTLVSPLHVAARLAALRSLQALLSKGARVDQLDSQGWSCMHHLAVSDADGECKAQALQMLRRAGGDADGLTPTQQAPLHLAARAGATDPFLSHLLLATREPGARDIAGRTALHYVALASGVVAEPVQLQVARLLLRFRAVDPRDRDEQQYTAADLAAARGQESLAGVLRRAEVTPACSGRWVMPSVLWLGMGGSHACCAVFVLPLVTSGWPAALLCAALICAVCTGVAATVRSPGYLEVSVGRPSGSTCSTTCSSAAATGPQRHAQWCYTCHLRRPLRSKHCRSCNRCVRDFDHHCPWLNNCVGRSNRGSFLLFVSALLLDVLILNVITLSAALTPQPKDHRAAHICHGLPFLCEAYFAHHSASRSAQWALYAASCAVLLLLVCSPRGVLPGPPPLAPLLVPTFLYTPPSYPGSCFNCCV